MSPPAVVEANDDEAPNGAMRVAAKETSRRHLQRRTQTHSIRWVTNLSPWESPKIVSSAEAEERLGSRCQADIQG